MRVNGLRLALVLAILGVIAALFPVDLPGEDQTPPAAVTRNQTAWRLEGKLEPLPSHFGCAGCHFGWQDPAGVEAFRGNASNVSLRFRPVTSYEVTAFAAPRSPGSDAPIPWSEERSVPIRMGAPQVLAFDLPWAAAGVVAEVRGQYSYDRPDVRATLRVGDAIAVEAHGSPSSKLAIARAETGRLAGTVEVDVWVRDPRPRDLANNLLVRVWAFPEGYRLVENATRHAPGVLEWPAEELAGAQELDVVAFITNEHPTDRFQTTVDADGDVYVGTVGLATPEPVPGPRATLPPSGSGASRVLREETFDGLLNLARNERGEWIWTDVNVEEEDPRGMAWEIPPPSIPFPTLPPGTTHVRTTLTWAPRVPGTPAPEWIVAYTIPPEPDFFESEPVSMEAGRRVDVIPLPVAPNAPLEGFQAIPLLALDESGRASFEGRYTFTVEAFTGPVPAP